MTFDLDGTTPESDISTIDGLMQELQNQAALLIAVATGGPRIQAVEAEYQRRRRQLVRALERRGLQYPFPWHDLQLWYGYWHANLPNYISRRTHISQLVGPVLEALERQQSDLTVIDLRSKESTSEVSNLDKGGSYRMFTPLEVFCCYAREDQEMLVHLKKHLVPLERQGQITIWSDTNLNAGVEWEKELHQHLESADIILLLISPDFMASDYCYSTEMGRALARHNEGNAVVIPMLLRSTFWQNAPFAKLQMVPMNAKPLTSWPDRDDAFHNITMQINQAVSELQTRRAQVVAPQNYSAANVRSESADDGRNENAQRRKDQASPMTDLRITNNSIALSRTEIAQLVNQYIGVSGGYLGDFNYRTHAEFYLDYCNLNINPNEHEGTTRERFITILSSLPPRDQAAVVRGVLNRFLVEAGPATRTAEMHNKFLQIIQRLESGTPYF